MRSPFARHTPHVSCDAGTLSTTCFITSSRLRSPDRPRLSPEAYWSATSPRRRRNELTAYR